MALAGFLIFLVVMIFVKNHWKSYFPKKNASIFSNLNKNDINGIEISSTNKSIHLVKKNNRWEIKNNHENLNADQEKVSQLINNFIALNKDEVISTNKNRQSELGIGSDKITFNTAKNTYTLYLGKNFTSEKNYLRIDDENIVFAGIGFGSILTDDFRDLNPYLVNDEQKVNNITLEYDNNKIGLIKKNNDWLVDNKKANKQTIDYFINDLKTLKASDIFSVNSITESLSYPTLRIKTNEKIAEFYPKDNDNYYLIIAGNDHIYQVATVYVTSLEKGEKDLIE
jgi:hypothetical protein